MNKETSMKKWTIAELRKRYWKLDAMICDLKRKQLKVTEAIAKRIEKP